MATRKITDKAFKYIDDKLKNHGAAQEAIRTKNARALLGFAGEVCLGVVESGGNNKGPMVQEFQKTVGGVASAEAWCMAYVQTLIAYVEKKLGVVSKIYASEHCMTTLRSSPASVKVKKIPAKNAITIWKQKSSDAGHTGIMCDYQGEKNTFLSNEGNTGGTSMRDGDGVYMKQRSKVKDGSLIIQGFLIPFTDAESKPDVTAPPVVTPAPEPDAKTTGMDADEGTVSWYRKMFKACKVNPDKATQLKNTLKIIREGYDRYLHVAKLLGAPNPANFAYILGAIHFKEASCNFKGVLHNGEKIVGTNKKTTIVPKGRGPFATWEEAAVDAISMNTKRWEKLMGGSIDIGEILYALERYNGTGYITGAGKAENSPYLWACSTINDGKGKYVSDGKFDANASTGSTCGAALILKEFFAQGDFKVVV